MDAIPKLHGLDLNTSKKKGGSAGASKLWARQLKGEGAMVKRWRLILRNLPFNVRALFKILP